MYIKIFSIFFGEFLSTYHANKKIINKNKTRAYKITDSFMHQGQVYAKFCAHK